MKIFYIPNKLSLNFNLNILFKQNYAVNESAFVKYMQKIIFFIFYITLGFFWNSEVSGSLELIINLTMTHLV